MNVNFYPEVDLASAERPAVTLGNFDGVHLGHQRIMKLRVERGEKLSIPTVAVTFEPQPISVLRPDMAPKRILTPEQ
ncbi:MAG: bifunctional riboflavin kinase/FMN adenylyltransferase, partial [Vicinamibacteria bacterium]